jgi:hypothetical protein
MFWYRYAGVSDLQRERMNVYFNEVCVLYTALIDLI